MSINGKRLNVEVADEAAEIKQGLSDRPSMQDNEGMLFLMPSAEIYPFWMYHMRFPLDIIWMRGGAVVEIARDVPPPSETYGVPVTLTPDAEADMVLELTAGGAERYGLVEGAIIDVSGLNP